MSTKHYQNKDGRPDSTAPGQSHVTVEQQARAQRTPVERTVTADRSSSSSNHRHNQLEVAKDDLYGRSMNESGGVAPPAAQCFDSVHGSSLIHGHSASTPQKRLQNSEQQQQQRPPLKRRHCIANEDNNNNNEQRRRLLHPFDASDY